MKSIIMPKNVQMTEETKDQLSTKEQETQATDTSVSANTKFTAADMWNRQRNIRSASDRLRRWNLS